MHKNLRRTFALLGSLLMLLAGLNACSVGVTICEVGQDCKVGQRCVEEKCQHPTAEGNHPPVARITGEARVKQGARVRLDGTTSSDVDLDYLTFKWEFSQKPEGSTSQIENATGTQAGFVADKAGVYKVRLTVKDPLQAADETEFTVTVNHPPIADAGGDKLVIPGAVVKLDGSTSRDLDDDPLTFKWLLLTRPSGSNSQLLDADKSVSQFTADKSGEYSVELKVSDGFDEAKQALKVTVIDPSQISPSLERLDPWKAPTDSVVTLNLYGQNFIQGANVFFDGQKIEATRYRSLTHITAQIELKGIKIGAHNIHVENPGGKQTKPLLFEVTQIPVPTLTSVTPNKGTSGEQVKVKVRGSGFVVGARVFFNDKPATTKYVDQSLLEATIELGGVAPGKYQVFVENGENRRSTPTPFEVIKAPPKPRIYRYTLSPSGATVGKTYTYLRLYVNGLLKDAKVIMNDKDYTGQAKVTMTSETSGYVDLAGFSSVGFREGRQYFKVRNTTPGKVATSDSFGIYFDDPNDPTVSYITFYKEGVSSSRVGNTETKYDYLRINGTYFSTSATVYIDGVKYNGTVRHMTSRELRLEPFSTQGFQEGEHKLYVRQEVNGLGYKSNEYTFTLQDGRIPIIQSVRSSDTTTTILYTNRKYTYFLIQGQNFYPDIEMVIDGVPHTGPKHLENDRQLYLYQIDTSTMQAGAHTLIVRNKFGGKYYSSKLYRFTLVDGDTPTITRIRWTPTAGLYQGETYNLSIFSTNASKDTKVLIDGKVYTGSVNATQTLVQLPTFDTTNLSIGSHVVQLRNTKNGKTYDSKPYNISIIQRPAPRIYSTNPAQVPVGQITTVAVNGRYFSAQSVILVDGTQVPSTYRSQNQLEFKLDGTALKPKVLDIQVQNPDKQVSNVFKLTLQPNTGPILWRISPYEIQIGGIQKEISNSSVRLNLQGQQLNAGGSVLLNGKTTLPASSATGNNVTVNIPIAQLGTASSFTLSYKDKDGKVSNAIRVDVHGTKKPEIYRVSPVYLTTSIGTRSISVYGRGIGPQSQLYLDNTLIKTTYYSYPQNNAYSAYIRGTINAADYANRETIKLTVKQPDGTTSDTFVIGGPAQSLQLQSSPSSYIYTGDNRTFTNRIYGKGFTQTTQLYLNGKLIPTTFTSSTRLNYTWKVDSSLKAGMYAHWQLKDGNLESNHQGSYVSGGPQLSQVTPWFVSQSQTNQTIQISLTNTPQNATLTLFGKAHNLSNTTKFSIPIGTEITSLKPGVHSATLKDNISGYTTSFGVYLDK